MAEFVQSVTEIPITVINKLIVNHSESISFPKVLLVIFNARRIIISKIFFLSHLFITLTLEVLERSSHPLDFHPSQAVTVLRLPLHHLALCRRRHELRHISNVILAKTMHLPQGKCPCWHSSHSTSLHHWICSLLSLTLHRYRVTFPLSYQLKINVRTRYTTTCLGNMPFAVN